MNIETTDRGFRTIKFSDHYNVPCSLQESSLAEEPAIWLGVGSGSGQRMHLTKPLVRALMPFLHSFLATGELADAEGSPETKEPASVHAQSKGRELGERVLEKFVNLLSATTWDPASDGPLYTTTAPSQDTRMMPLCDAGFAIGTRDWSAAGSFFCWRWTLTERGEAELREGLRSGKIVISRKNTPPKPTCSSLAHAHEKECGACATSLPQVADQLMKVAAQIRLRINTEGNVLGVAGMRIDVHLAGEMIAALTRLT